MLVLTLLGSLSAMFAIAMAVMLLAPRSLSAISLRSMLVEPLSRWMTSNKPVHVIGTIALVLLFVLSFVLHALGGAREYSAEQVAHGQLPVSIMKFVTTSTFWFQSFQNWQSEFVAVGSIVVLTIFLRQKGSPESKPVAAPHDETGG